MPRLRRVDCSTPGIRRLRAGRGFVYRDPDGERITDEEVRARIAELRIPPAWTDVWICVDDRGHIQATGVDAKGRTQYLYHASWRRHRDREKFEKMARFGRALPKIRHFVAEHLDVDGYPKERVLACAVRLLDLGFFRIGGESYADENDSFGLATMLKVHVRVREDWVIFDYPSKSGKQRVQSVVDPGVRDVVAGLKARRGGGPELLAYKQSARWCDVKSTDINAYIRDVAGEEFTAKDFRTWNATLLAAVALAVAKATNGSKTARQRAITRAYKEVAGYLGNTPAVARASYVDPRVVDRFRAGHDVSGALEDLAANDLAAGLAVHGAVEDALLDLLEDGLPAN